MADFCFPWSRAVVNGPFSDQSAADSAAKRDVKYRVMSHARPAPGFAQSPNISIVVHDNGGGHERPEPSREIEFRPAFDLVRPGDFACAPIYRTAEANTNSLKLHLLPQVGQRALDLLADSCAPTLRIHC